MDNIVGRIASKKLAIKGTNKNKVAFESIEEFRLRIKREKKAAAERAEKAELDKLAAFMTELEPNEPEPEPQVDRHRLGQENLLPPEL